LIAFAQPQRLRRGSYLLSVRSPRKPFGLLRLKSIRRQTRRTRNTSPQTTFGCKREFAGVVCAPVRCHLARN